MMQQTTCNLSNLVRVQEPRDVYLKTFCKIDLNVLPKMGHVMLCRLNREHGVSSVDVWGSDVVWDTSQVKLYMLTIRDYRRQSNVPLNKQTQQITQLTSHALVHI
jgi:hypothetical protein